MRGSGILLLTVAAAGLLGQAFAQDATRKGTRNHVPDAVSDSDAADQVNTLEGCMATWDAATHISKVKWREICKRQIRAGAAHSGAVPADRSEP